MTHALIQFPRCLYSVRQCEAPRCVADRRPLLGFIQPMQMNERVVSFFVSVFILALALTPSLLSLNFTLFSSSLSLSLSPPHYIVSTVLPFPSMSLFSFLPLFFFFSLPPFSSFLLQSTLHLSFLFYPGYVLQLSLIQFRLVKMNILDIRNYILPIHYCHFRYPQRHSSYEK